MSHSASVYFNINLYGVSRMHACGLKYIFIQPLSKMSLAATVRGRQAWTWSVIRVLISGGDHIEVVNAFGLSTLVPGSQAQL